MTTMSLSHSGGNSTSNNKDLKMQTFQQLAMIPSDSVDVSLQMFPESTNPFHNPVSPTTSNEMEVDDMMSMSKRLSMQIISARRIGSSSRSQWSGIDNQDTCGSLATATFQGSVAMKELDLALRDENDDDDDSTSTTYMASEATYAHSEATAVTGNVNSNSSATMMRNMVTPENSPGKGSDCRRKGRSSDNDILLGRQNNRPSGTPDQKRNPVMCGAIGSGVNDELRGSIQDVNDTLSLIFSTVRRFGPKEKDAVKETFKDATYYVKEKVRAALPLRKENDEHGSSRSPDRVSMNISPKRRGGTVSEFRDKSASRSTVHEIRRRERLMMEDESEEVVYDKSGSEPDAELTRMLV